MIGALLLLAVAALGGTLLTWLFDGRPPGYARVAAGVIVGWTILACACYVAALVLGMGPAVLLIGAAVSLLPAAALARPGPRERIVGDVQDGVAAARESITAFVARPRLTIGGLARLAYVAGLGAVLWLVSDRTLFETADGLSIGNVNNLGDLPYHVSITTGFALGDNVPPENPVFAGAGLSYHYMSDFLAALPMVAGATLVQAWFMVTVLLLWALAAVLHRWARDVTGSVIAARLVPLLVLASGGSGWVLLIGEARRTERGLVEAFMASDARYTLDAEGFFRFGNAVTTLLVPQRGLLLGMGLAVIILTLLWQQLDVRPRLAAPRAGPRPAAGIPDQAPTEGRRVPGRPELPGRRPIVGWQRMLTAGLLTGVLPIVHIHTFAVVFGTAALLGVIFRQWREDRWRAWAVYVVATVAAAIPALLWTARGTAASITSFLGVEIGWDHGDHNLLLFWIGNAGLFLALLAVAYLWPALSGQPPILGRKMVRYTAAFMVWFVVANVFRLAPWIWDNIKVLIFWWLGGSAVVALALAGMWERRTVVARLVASALFVALIAAGSLDIARATVGPRTFQEWDRDGIAFADAVRTATPAGSVILAAPSFNSPVLLTGRPVLMGYPGWLFANGLPYSGREQDVRAMYAGDPGAEDLLRRYGIRYVVVGPQEQGDLRPAEAFLAKFPVVVQVGGYRLHQVSQ